MVNLDDVADFIWLYDDEFFLITEKGNYIWSSPMHNGDNTIREYHSNLSHYLEETGIACGKCKGRHMIKSYCGDKVIFTVRLDNGTYLEM